MNKIFSGKIQRRLFSQFKKERYQFDFFDFQANKVSAEKEKHWEGLTAEEVLGMDNLGFESARYKAENKKMWMGIALGLMLTSSYAYSFYLENEILEETYHKYVDGEF